VSVCEVFPWLKWPKREYVPPLLHMYSWRRTELRKGGGGGNIYLYLHKVIYTMACPYVFRVVECGLFNCAFLKA